MHDLEEIRCKISLIALAEQAGARFQSANRLSSCCPLPRHAGDRSNPTAFHIYQDGRMWKCFSSCPEGANGGDVIAFYMALKEVDFKTAVEELVELAKVAPDHSKTPTDSQATYRPLNPLKPVPHLSGRRAPGSSSNGRSKT